MPFLVISTSYASDHFGKKTIIGGEKTDLTAFKASGFDPFPRPEYKRTGGKWHVVEQPAREVIKKLAEHGFRIHSQCVNDTDMFYTLHKPLEE